MNQKNILVVFIYIAVCGLLVAGLSMFLGPEKKAATSELNLTNTEGEEFVAPFSLEERNAHNTIMTSDKNPIAEFDTNQGKFQLELFEDTMPVTAGNFIKLAEEGFYDQVKFHRVIPNFMIQGGDPLTKEDNISAYGTGGPGYAIPDEHVVGDNLTNLKGTISMANSGPNTGGSQFFINVADNSNLDFDKQPLASKHPVFGKVISGMEIVDQIALVERNERDLPLEPVVINSVKIVRQ